MPLIVKEPIFCYAAWVRAGGYCWWDQPACTARKASTGFDHYLKPDENRTPEIRNTDNTLNPQQATILNEPQYHDQKGSLWFQDALSPQSLPSGSWVLEASGVRPDY